MQGGAALVNRLGLAGADHGDHESDARQKQDEAKDRARDRGDPLLHLGNPACDGDKKAVIHVGFLYLLWNQTDCRPDWMPMMNAMMATT